MPLAVLKISDDTTTINLLGKDGYIHSGWRPAITAYKDGGVRQGSSLSDGSRLVHKQFDNVIETISLKAVESSQDMLIQTTQELRRLLEKAANYWTTKWQDEPVWIEARASQETNTRYAIIHQGRIPEDENPYSQPFLQPGCKAVMDNITLIIERGPWTPDEPGTGTCVEASGTQENWMYDEWLINTAAPVGNVNCLIDAACGYLIAGDATGTTYRTANGAVWAVATTGMGIPHIPLAFVEAQDGFLYVTCGGGGSIWRSSDCADNWVNRILGVGALYPYCITDGRDGYLYLANYGSGHIERSNDGGATWVNVVAHAYPRSIVNPSVGHDYSGYIYAVGDGGIYRGIGGLFWEKVFEWTGAVTHAIIKEVNGFLYATFDFLLHRSTNGTDWDMVEKLGIVGGHIYDIIYASDGFYYLSLATDDILRGDGISSWEVIENIGGAGYHPLAEFSFNDTIYAGETGNIWWNNGTTVDVGRTATCSNEVFAVNKQNIAQITDVWVYDSTLGTWTAQFPAAAFPFNLLPNPPVVGDILYIGIDSSLPNTGPFGSFNNVVFDLIGALYTTWGIDIEYYNGVAWVGLPVTDGTNELTNSGVSSLHWEVPANWVLCNLFTLFGGGAPNVQGFWIRFEVTAATGANRTPPQQQNRDIYTINWPNVDIDDSQIAGDIPALIECKTRNRSDRVRPGGGGPDAWLDRLLISLRGHERGTDFISFLNCSDEQIPAGIVTTAGTGTAFTSQKTAPTGRVATHTTTGNGLTVYDDAFTITLGASLARDFYGVFHVFFRAHLYEPAAFPAGDHTDVRIRLRLQSGSGGVSTTTDYVEFTGVDEWDLVGAAKETYHDFQLLDFGRESIPISDLVDQAELPDEVSITVQVASAAATNLLIDMYDIIILTTDEWIGDFINAALEDDSMVENGYLLDVDSVRRLKSTLRCLAREVGDIEFIRSIYSAMALGPAILQANVDQSLYFLSARAIMRGKHTGGMGVATLTDTNSNIIAANVRVGMTVHNVTDGSSAIITAITATTITGTLGGGVVNVWNTDDEWYVLCMNWRAEPWLAYSIQLISAQRYLSMRGAR